jgi:hypothetical protein
MTALRPFRKVLAILIIAIGLAAVACLLPDRPYERWQLLNGTLHEKCHWIYERIHFDPRPIDVAVVGPSRIVRGIDARRMETELRRNGVTARVANFALPEGGRDTNDVIVEEMLTRKIPKLLIIGVIEKPSRFGHPAFKYIAPTAMAANPGYPTNAHYLETLIYLPFRQLRLFTAYLFPGAFGLTDRFEPAKYKADPTEDVVFKPDNGVARPASEAAPLHELQVGAARLSKSNVAPILPPSLADLEFGDERYYIRRIVKAARAHGVKVAFLFLPYFSGPTTIQEEPFYSQFGPVWNAGFMASHPEFYSDYAHMTTEGAGRVNAWISPTVAAMITSPRPAR